MTRLVALASGLAVLAACLLLGARAVRRQDPTAIGRRPGAEPAEVVRPAGLPTAGRVKTATSFGSLPVSFEKNAGQTDPQARFLARSGSGTVFITPTGAAFALAAAHPARGEKRLRASSAEAKPRREAVSFGMKVVVPYLTRP